MFDTFLYFRFSYYEYTLKRWPLSEGFIPALKTSKKTMSPYLKQDKSINMFSLSMVQNASMFFMVLAKTLSRSWSFSFQRFSSSSSESFWEKLEFLLIQEGNFQDSRQGCPFWRIQSMRLARYRLQQSLNPFWVYSATFLQFYSKIIGSLIQVPNQIALCYLVYLKRFDKGKSKEINTFIYNFRSNQTLDQKQNLEIRNLSVLSNSMRVLSSSAPTFKPQQTQSQRQEQQQLALLERVVRKFYFIHLVVIALVYTYLLIEEKNFRLSFTSVLLGIYCYMIVWNWAVNFFLVVIGKDNIAVVFNRVIIRFIIMIFFPIGLSAIVAQNYLGIKLVLALLLYLCLISLLFFIYEIYGCTCGEPSNPKYIFEHNDLHAETQKVWQIRRKYNKEILSNWEENSLSLSQRHEKH